MEIVYLICFLLLGLVMGSFFCVVGLRLGREENFITGRSYCDSCHHELVTKDFDKKLYISNPKSNIAVGSIQMFLDDYLKDYSGKLDYIHGDEITRSMGSEEGNVGILFEVMPKEELFRTVILDGTLPRKTFSMGHSYDKRYYLEARKIK